MIIRDLANINKLIGSQVSEITILLSEQNVLDKDTSIIIESLIENESLTKLTLQFQILQNEVNLSSLFQMGVAKCSNLTDLSLFLTQEQSNKLDKDFISNLFFGLSNCKKITSLTLYLDNAILGEEEFTQLSQAISKLDQLSTLSLSLSKNNIFDQNCITLLGEILEKCKNIQDLYLNLCQNKIDETSIAVLGKSISKCINLSKFSIQLYDNNIRNDGFIQLSSCIQNCINLKNICLNVLDNQITEEGVIGFCQNIQRIQNLEEFELSQIKSGLGIEALQNLSSTITKQDQTLKSLSLNLEQIGEENLNIFIAEITNCQKLTTLTLWLSSNCIKDLGLSMIAESLTKFSNLAIFTLWLSFNEIKCEGASKLGKCIGQMKNLYSLTLSVGYNQIEKDGINDICEGISNCKYLNYLFLVISGNQYQKPENFKNFYYKLKRLVITDF